MNQPIQGCKAEEVAVLPLRFKLNLQHFADDVEVQETDAPDVDVEDDDITWEPFESDKPKVDEVADEQPEVVEPEPEKPKQDHETNKAFQEIRKAKEEAERKASEADTWAKQTWGHLGINTFKEYQQALAEEQKKQEYQEKGIDYEEVKKIAKEELANHPEVLRAKNLEAKLSVNAEIRDLKSAYPDVDVREVDDLSDLIGVLEKLPNWDKIQQKVNRGYELKDAYELVNKDEISSKRVAAAEQSARNKINSKSHLKPNSAGDAGEVFVMPDDVMKMYREVNSKLPKSQRRTEEQMREHYKKSMRK